MRTGCDGTSRGDKTGARGTPPGLRSWTCFSKEVSSYQSTLFTYTDYTYFGFGLDFKQVIIPTNQQALDFEKAMKVKTLILSSLFFARHQGGSESLDDFLAFAEKFEAKQSDDFALKATLESTFLCTPTSVLEIISSNENVFKSMVKEMYTASLGIDPKVLFNSEAEGSREDLRCMQLRKILVSTIKSEKS